MATQQELDEVVAKIAKENREIQQALNALPSLARRDDDIGLLARAVLGVIDPERSVNDMVKDHLGFHLRQF